MNEDQAIAIADDLEHRHGKAEVTFGLYCYAVQMVLILSLYPTKLYANTKARRILTAGRQLLLLIFANPDAGPRIPKQVSLLKRDSAIAVGFRITD